MTLGFYSSHSQRRPLYVFMRKPVLPNHNGHTKLNIESTFAAGICPLLVTFRNTFLRKILLLLHVLDSCFMFLPY